jgi:hypothetical protein
MRGLDPTVGFICKQDKNGLSFPKLYTREKALGWTAKIEVTAGKPT